MPPTSSALKRLLRRSSTNIAASFARQIGPGAAAAAAAARAAASSALSATPSNTSEAKLDHHGQQQQLQQQTPAALGMRLKKAMHKELTRPFLPSFPCTVALKAAKTSTATATPKMKASQLFRELSEVLSIAAASKAATRAPTATAEEAAVAVLQCYPPDLGKSSSSLLSPSLSIFRAGFDAALYLEQLHKKHAAARTALISA
jgi:hypothetical protein